MNYDFQEGQIIEIADVIFKRGWGHILGAMHEHIRKENSVARVKGEPFQDGKLVGRVEMMSEILHFFGQLITAVEKHTGEDG
jgi:hypothetical protein